MDDFIGVTPEYLRAPTSFLAAKIYNIGKEEILTGPENLTLLKSRKEQGFIAVE